MFCMNKFLCFDLQTIVLTLIILIIISLYHINQQTKEHYLFLKNKKKLYDLQYSK